MGFPLIFIYQSAINTLFVFDYICIAIGAIGTLINTINLPILPFGHIFPVG